MLLSWGSHLESYAFASYLQEQLGEARESCLSCTIQACKVQEMPLCTRAQMQ